MRLQILFYYVLGASFVLNLILILKLHENGNSVSDNTSNNRKLELNLLESLSHNIKFPEVKKIPWNYENSSQFINQLIETAEPVILTSSPLLDWPAFHLWTYDYIIGALGRELPLPEVWEAPSPVIFRSTNIYSWPGLKDNYERRSMTVEEFFLKFKKPELYGYLYFSGDVSEGKGIFKKIFSDISPSVFSPHPSIKTDNNFWIGSPGVTSQCHYDFSQNFYLQLRGIKQFILLPPKEEILNPFPFAHPYGRRSQNNYTEMKQSQADEFAKYGAVEANLKRGDVLFIPSLWSHHVTNIDGSLSLNVWFRTTVQKMISNNLDIFVTPPNLDPSLKKSFLKHTLELLFQKLQLNIKKFMKKHFELRWSKLFEKDLDSKENHKIEKECRALPKILAKISSFAEDEILEFQYAWDRIPEYMKEVHLRDYVDAFVTHLLEPPENLFFIKYCFV